MDIGKVVKRRIFTLSVIIILTSFIGTILKRIVNLDILTSVEEACTLNVRANTEKRNPKEIIKSDTK